MDTEPNTKPCPICNGIMCWMERDLDTGAHWHCVECGRVEISKEEKWEH